jgi:hypothetical protein
MQQHSISLMFRKHAETPLSEKHAMEETTVALHVLQGDVQRPVKIMAAALYQTDVLKACRDTTIRKACHGD